MYSLILLKAVLLLICGGGLAQEHGPVFLQEPPSRLVFSNNTGASAPCSAHGFPPPQVTWHLSDGSIVLPVPGLRTPMDNGSLVFSSFPSSHYRQDIHGAVYRCRASNSVGAVLSRDMHVTAVVWQDYNVMVTGGRVSSGNTAVLTCSVPPSVKEHVVVTAWYRDDTMLLPGPAESGRYVVSGNILHIRGVRPDDVHDHFSCTTENTLTNDRRRSAPVKLEITDLLGPSPPRFTSNSFQELTVKRGGDIHISCAAEGNPIPTITWLRDTDGMMRDIQPSLRISVSPDLLILRRAEPSDSGRWACRANNALGERTQNIRLGVTSHLSAHIHPQLQIVNSGGTAVLNCTISGSPLGSIQWLHDGIPVSGGQQENHQQSINLILSALQRSDAGMYQCIARNDIESAQASAEIRLGDTAPELQYTFIEQALRGGPAVSLRCSASGTPSPRFQWLLDGQQITSMSRGLRYQIGQFNGKNSEVVTHLNISNVRSEDGGLYSCKAFNHLGEVTHTARLNIYGPPYVRSISPIRAVAGREIILYCPYSGYPISSVKWEKSGGNLLTNSQHGPEYELKIPRVESSHAGAYTCIVSAPEGQQAKREIQLLVNNPPEIEPFSFPSNLQEGRRAQVSCSVTSGDMPVYFTWYKDNLPIPASLQVEERGADFFSNLVFKDVTSHHSGLYTCVASNSAAKVNFSAELVVKVPPKWVNEPQDAAALAGSSLALHCKTRGSPNPQTTWLKQSQGSDFIPLINLGGRFKFLTNGTLWIDGASTHDEGQYMCKAENGIGTPLSKVIYVSVNDPARFDVSSKNITARKNDPITLVCDALGDNPIQISWTHNMKRLDLNTYRLSTSEVKTESGLRSQLFISRTDRLDSGIYKCQASNAFGSSDHLIYLSVQERPDPPQSLNTIRMKSRKVELQWSQGFDGNSPLIGYSTQYVALQNYNSKIPWEESSTQNISVHSLKKILPNQAHNKIGDTEIKLYEATITGLKPSTMYAMRIQAINQIEHSLFTEAVMFQTDEEAPSEPPFNLHVQAGGPGELLISWQMPPKDTWNGELLGYTIMWYEQTPGMPLLNSTKSATVNGHLNTAFNLSGLKKFTRYGITVKAFNRVAAGPVSAVVSATTMEGVPEAPPQGVACTALSALSIKVSWRPPIASHHGGLIQGYKVFYTPQINDYVEYDIDEVKKITTTETYIHGLHKYTNYSIQVLAYTSAGDGKRSSPIFCTTEEDVPSQPQKIKALPLSRDAVLVSWLPPLNPNGKIVNYNVYQREAGRIGKHSAYTVSPLSSQNLELSFEVRSLAEHQLYEFWVSAATLSGEGEPTSIIAQGPNSRAPARIGSFSQVIKRAIGSSITLSCLAVGNPNPRAIWMHRSITVTHTPHYQVTPQGNLNIHSLGNSSSGNFTCTASNLFGEDTITYTVIAIMPPSAVTLHLQYTTASSIKIHWQPPPDGGSPILGYTLLYKTEKEITWQGIELSPEINSYVLETLKCGSLYLMKIQAINRVAIGPSSEILSTNTKGSLPKAPKEFELMNSNSTAVKLNLYTWADGGCPITKIKIEYRAIEKSEWINSYDGPLVDTLVVSQLTPAQWYQLKVFVTNDAGTTSVDYNMDTTRENGARILPLDPSIALTGDGRHTSLARTLLVPAASLALLLIAVLMLTCLILKSRKLRCLINKRYNRDDRKLSESNDLEREKLRDGQKLYSSSSINGNEKSNDDSSELYEISPYATFGEVTGRTPGRGPVEHALHFRTFSVPENEAGPARIPSSHRKHRRLHRCDTFEYDESTLSKAMTMEMRSAHFGIPQGVRNKNHRNSAGMAWERHKHHEPPDTDSEDNSDSPGNTTVKDSRCDSPISGERSYTPGRLQMTRCSSGIYLNGRSVESVPKGLPSPKPSCEPISNIAVPPNITVLIDKYQQKKEQERRECTIHV